jgi:hypothetical protein
VVKSLSSVHLLLAAILLTGIAGAQSGTNNENEKILPAGTRISLQLNDFLSTKSNNEGDAFTATVTEPVYLQDRIVIPKGSIVSGSISRILRPGRFKGKALMNLLFSSIRMQGVSEAVPIVAFLARLDPEGNDGTKSEGTIVGEGSKGSDAAKVASQTIGGAGIGTIVGGGRGAAVGAGVGAAVGLATILAGRGKDLELRRGLSMEIILDHPLDLPDAGKGVIIKRLND